MLQKLSHALAFHIRNFEGVGCVRRTANSKFTRTVHNLNTRRVFTLATNSYGTLQTHPNSIDLEISTAQDMEDLGAVLAIGTMGGDVLVLDGDLGAGKTCFSRGFVRARTGLTDIRVTSPTYLLSNTYPADNGDVIIHHMDLYRLSDGKPEALEPLNLVNVLKNCISLIEWPSRLGQLLPPDRLELTFKMYGDPSTDNYNDDDDDESTTRIVTIKPHGKRWEQKLEKICEEGYLDDLIIEYDVDE